VFSLIERLVHPPVDFLLREIGAAREFARDPVVAGNHVEYFGRHEAIDNHDRIVGIGHLRKQSVRLDRQKVGIAGAGTHEGDATAVGETLGGFLGVVERWEVGGIGNAPFVVLLFSRSR